MVITSIDANVTNLNLFDFNKVVERIDLVLLLLGANLEYLDNDVILVEN